MIMDSLYWEALSMMAKDKGYDSRNDLIATALMQMVDREPDYKSRGHEESKVKHLAKEMLAPWNPPLRPVSDQDMKEIFGDDLDLGLYQGPVAQEPELPEL